MKALHPLSLMLCLLVAPLATAQICPDWDYTEAWVDPVFGVDATAQVDDPALPYRTIGAAISDVRASQGANGGIVRCLPGLYGNDPCGNGESFPIVMRNGVHVIGAGAKECVIRGDGTTDNRFAFYPTVPAGSRDDIEALVDFSAVGPSNEDPAFDGFTLQGGDVQVYCESEFEAAGVISNCVFDMRDTLDMPGPEFGVLVVSVYYGEPHPYNDQRLNVINNTFIQGRQLPAPLAPEVARASNVAICDVNDPAPFWGTAIDPTQPRLRGVGQPNIQNNVIRSLPEAPRTALLGVGSDDTQNTIGTNPGNTNAFDSTLVGGLDLSGTYSSAITSPTPPAPRVQLNLALGGEDPGFLGEMIALSLAATNPGVRDWRLLPDSNLVDQGSAPDPVAGTCDEFLTAANGTSYLNHGGDWPASSFDWDGDGYGNRRVAGDEPDIGMDETDLFHVAGSYGNDAKTHQGSGYTWAMGACTNEPGSTRRVMVFPTTVAVAGLFATVQQWGVIVVGGLAVFAPSPAWTNMPCTLNPSLPTPLGLQYLGGPPGCDLLNFGSPVPALTAWLNPVDGVTHVFGQALLDFNEDPTLEPLFFNEQCAAFVEVAPGVFEIQLTNLQSEYL